MVPLTLRVAASKWIPNETWTTRTYRTMIYNSTDCIQSTMTWARVRTFLVDAGLLLGTF